MDSFGLLLALLGAPGVDAEPPPRPESTQDERSAWDAAGWGSAPTQPAELVEPAAQPHAEGPKLESEGPEPSEAAPQSEPNSAWDAAGWGGEPPAEDPIEGPIEPDAGSDWSQWNDSTAGSSSADAVSSEEDEDKLKAGDILAGSVRLTGSYLHFDDNPDVFPNGDDAMLVTVARLLLEADVGEHVHFSFNGFGELSRVPGGASLGGSFASAGSTRSSYRTRYLTWQYWDDGAVGGQLGVDRASMRLKFDPVNIEVGRFPVTYTVASMFTTNDFFAPFSATAVNRIYKPGVDAIRVSTGFGSTGSVDVVGVLGYDPDSDEPSWGRSAVFTRAAVVGGGFEWAALGGKVAQRWIAGGSIQGGAGPIDLRGEFHIGIADEHGDGHDSTDRPIYGRFSAGPSVTFGWQNASIVTEYHFASDGAAKPANYIDRALASYSDDLPYLGQHYVGLAASAEIIPILRASVTGIVSATDGSGLAGVSLIYNVADESDLILGVFVPWGAGVRGVDPMSGSLSLGSEFGLSPISAYLEARVFF
ncbi:hypothetical protein [Enhygromyxa salina]|uniref:Porin n=1 Tax=Enhygromyxa salina TaxID=215803 RepID=A0A2S9YYJ2_9BACT|nr:hypothetical protein [Enhygromyxa salina]PRQ10144.1 hypothetical protein ENSA7_00930 [Enhygromyxa salina]